MLLAVILLHVILFARCVQGQRAGPTRAAVTARRAPSLLLPSPPSYTLFHTSSCSSYKKIQGYNDFLRNTVNSGERARPAAGAAGGRAAAAAASACRMPAASSAAGSCQTCLLSACLLQARRR